MPREYGQVNPDGTISVIRENDDGTYEVVRTESREKNQGIQPKAATSSAGAGGGGTNPFPGAEFVNPDLQKLLAEIADWAATQEYNRRRLEEVDKPTLQLQKDIAAFNQAVSAINSLISAAGLQSQEALGVAGIIANLRGPSSAFKQMEVAYGLNQSGATRSFDALAGKYSMPSFQAPQGTPEAVSLATLSRDMQQVGGQTGQMTPIEQAIKAAQDLMTKFGSPGASTPGGSTPMTDEQALDWIWANVDAKHPQLKQTYAANGWASDTPEQRRAIIQNWIGQADPQWKGMNPLQVAARLGYTAPTPTQEQVLNNAGAKTGIGTGAATGPTQTPLSNNVSASSGMASSGPLGQQTTYRPGGMTPPEQQRAIAYNEALRAAGKQTEDFRMPPQGWQPGMPVQYQPGMGQYGENYSRQMPGTGGVRQGVGGGQPEREQYHENYGSPPRLGPPSSSMPRTWDEFVRMRDAGQIPDWMRNATPEDFLLRPMQPPMPWQRGGYPSWQPGTGQYGENYSQQMPYNRPVTDVDRAYNDAYAKQQAAQRGYADMVFRYAPQGWQPGMPLPAPPPMRQQPTQGGWNYSLSEMAANAGGVANPQPTGLPGFTAPTIKGTPGSLGEMIEQQGRSHLYSGNPRAWADLNALPGATNKIAGKEFLKMDPYGQQVALGAYETAGYAPEFTLDQIQKGLPRFRAPRMGVVA